MARKTELEVEPPKRRRRWWLLLLIVLAVAWFAPAIAMRSPLKQTVLLYANPGIDGDIEVDRSQVGWLSPIVLRGVRVKDRAGKVVAEADLVSSRRTLWSLVTDSTDLGAFAVAGVKARIEGTASGSNIEEILAPMFVGPSTPEKYQYRIDISDASVVLFNKDTGRASQLANINGFVNSNTLGNAYPEIALTLTAYPDESNGRGGDVQCNLTWSPPTTESPIRGNVRVRGTDVSLQTFGPVVSRFLPDTFIDGEVKCDFAFDWSDSADRPGYRFRGGFAGDSLQVSSPAYLGTDQLRVSRVQLGGSVSQADNLWAFDELRAKTDFADVTASGSMTFEADGTPVPSANRPMTLAGTIDVADLANRLPNTMRLRDGLRMTEGTATISLKSERSPTAWFWEGELKTAAVRAERDGQRIEWNDPLTLNLRLRNHQQSYAVERVSAESDFLTVTGNGNLDKLHLDATCDLNQFKKRLEQFIDVADWQLAGTVTGNASFTRDAGGSFSANASVTATDFAMRSSVESSAWREANFNIEAVASGTMGPQQTVREVETFTVNLTSGSDRLTSRLLEPVTAEMSEGLELPVFVRVQGRLESWLARVKPFVSLPIEDATGAIDLQTTASASQQRITFQTANVTATDLHINVSKDLIIAEPKLVASTLGRIDFARQSATFPSFEIRTAAVQAVGQDVHMNFGAQPGASAKCAVVGNLALISAWQQGEPASKPMTGEVRGNLVLAFKDEILTAQVDATLMHSNLLSVLETRPTQIAQNPNSNRPIGAPATLMCKVQYDKANDDLQISKARIDCDAVSLQATGSVADVMTKLRTDLNGKIAYDFEHLNALLRASLGDHVRVVGRGSHPFELSGPLTGNLDDISGSGKVSWQSALVYGLQCGAGEVNVNIVDGVVRSEPITFDLNGGTARLLPALDLRENMTLHVAKGTAIQNVQLTEEVTSEWLKFVAPLLADSARVQGTFSAGINAATIPLSEPLKGDIAGAIQIHSGQAQPGPIVNQIVGVIDQVRTIIGKKARGAAGLRANVPEQIVRFRMVQERVHHEGFMLKVDGVSIRTSGSVGLDQSLQLVAEMTLPEKWLGSSQFAQALRGRALKIPISGTFRRPRVDPSILRTLGRDAASGAAGNLLRKNLDRSLDKLFDKIK